MFGLNNLSTNSILPNRVLATGDPIQKAGGITIDWSTVAATGSLTNHGGWINDPVRSEISPLRSNHVQDFRWH